MERIRSALERAREQRQAQARLHLPAYAASRAQPRLEDIAYTVTRTVSLDARALHEPRIIAGHEGPLVDAYKLLRTQVLGRMQARGFRTLALTSAGPGAGKTLTAINLGLSMAREATRTVLLVDADLRRPRVAELLGLLDAPGLTEHLLDGAPLHGLLVNPGIPRFVLLPGGRPAPAAAELLAGRAMRALVRELRVRYPERYVLFDAPPALPGAEVAGLVSLVEAALLVVEEGRTRKAELLKAVELLQGTELIGTVLNKAGRFR